MALVVCAALQAPGADGHLFTGGASDASVVPGAAASPNWAFAPTFSDSGTPLTGPQAATPAVAFIDSMPTVPACAAAALIASHVDGDLPGLSGLGNNDALVIATHPASPDDSIERRVSSSAAGPTRPALEEPPCHSSL